MAIIQREEPNEKVRKKILACREAGYKISQNFIAGLTIVEAEGVEILRATRQGDNKWLMEYNDEFWDEIPKEEPIPEEPKQNG